MVMRKIYIIFVLMFAVLPLWADEPYFYDGRGEKVTFSVRKDKVLLKYDSKSDAKTLQKQVAAKEIKLLREDMAVADIDTTKAQLSAIRKISSMQEATYMLESKSGTLMSPTGRLYVRCKNEISIDSILDDAGVSKKLISKELYDINAQIYIVAFDEKPEDRLPTAARLYETGLCEFVEPSFLVLNTSESIVSQNIARSATSSSANTTDYYPLQWGLKNTGQSLTSTISATSGYDVGAEVAWEITKGSSSIKVAVVDNGIEANHPDLAGKLLLGYNALLNEVGMNCTGPDYNLLKGSHGTNCAGIIAAADNGIGVVGIAPNCKIIPIKIYNEYSFYPTDIIAGLRYACAEADVISCSWSGAGNDPYFSPLITALIDSAAVHGRNGKGCVVVFSAGNINSNGEAVRFPATLSSTIAVGAISPSGQWYNGSCYGAELDVVAPGAIIWTTGLNGGYSSLDGTSFACPFVSGIAALVLSVDPLLTSQEVRYIIESTTRKITPPYGFYYHYENGRPYTWEQRMGYGLVQADNAVALAQTFCERREYKNGVITTNTTVSDNDCIIEVQNFTVTNNAKLTLDARREIEINGPFEVTLGSELELMPE